MGLVQFDATAWRAILPAGLRQRRNQYGAMPRYFSLASLLLVPALVVALAPRGVHLWRLGLGMFGFLAAIYLLALWMLVVSQVMAQNTRFAARLVPGHAARLRGALLQFWGVLVLLAGGIGATFGVSLGAAVGVSALLAMMALLIGLVTNISVLTVVIFCALSSTVGRFLLDGFEAGWAMSPLAMATLALGLSAACLVAIVRSGGRVDVVAPARRAQAIMEQPVGRWIGHSSLRSGVFGLGSGVSTFRPGSSAVSRLLRGFAPTIHWIVPLLVLVPPLLFDLASICFGKLPTWLTFLFLVATLLLSILVIGNGLATFDVPARRRSDQALLALLPGLPRGVDLSRSLALRLAAYWIVAWTCVSLASLWLVEVSTARQGFPSWTVCMSIGVLPILPMACRRWARETSRTSDFLARFLVLVASVVAAICLVVLLRVELLEVATAYLALAAIGCAWCWHRMGTDPEPLPMGRLPCRRRASGETLG